LVGILESFLGSCQSSSCQHALSIFRTVFWVTLPCRMIVDRRFRGAYCLHNQGTNLLVRRHLVG
jgi:hypothetical protein